MPEDHLRCSHQHQHVSLSGSGAVTLCAATAAAFQPISVLGCGRKLLFHFLNRGGRHENTEVLCQHEFNESLVLAYMSAVTRSVYGGVPMENNGIAGSPPTDHSSMSPNA